MRSTSYPDIALRKESWKSEVNKLQNRLCAINDQQTKDILTRYITNINHRIKTHSGDSVDYAQIYGLLRTLNERISMITKWEKHISEISKKIKVDDEEAQKKIENKTIFLYENIHSYSEKGDAQPVMDAIMDLDNFVHNLTRIYAKSEAKNNSEAASLINKNSKSRKSNLSFLSLFCCFGCPDSCGDEETLIDESYFDSLMRR